MIFYPMEFRGWKLKVWAGQPLGLIGWTGIVPCKAHVLATRMVRMMAGSLIDVDQVVVGGGGGVRLGMLGGGRGSGRRRWG
jgi:hypothetical protein